MALTYSVACSTAGAGLYDDPVAASMRLVLRLLGLLCLAGAFAALIVDGTRSVAAGAVAILPLGETIGKISPDGLQQARRALEAKLPLLWDPLLVAVLRLPTWVVFGVVGLGLLALGRPRRSPMP